MKKAFLYLAVCLFVRDVNAIDARVFFKEYCNQCHGAEKQKGDLRLDTLQWQAANPDNVAIWQEIADQLDLGEMPPKDKPQPADTARTAMVDQLAKAIVSAAKKQGSRPVVLRRLNRTQYRNSLEDLLQIDLSLEDPTEAFPPDEEVDGFANIGEALQMSDFLLRQYLTVARSVVDMATFDGEQPSVEKYTMGTKSRPQNFHVGGHPKKLGRAVLFRNDEWAPGDPRGQNLSNCRDGAPVDGWYEITYSVESRGRGSLADKLKYSGKLHTELQVYYPDDLHRFEIYLVGPYENAQHQFRQRILADAFDMPDNEPHDIKRRYRLPKGWRIEAAFGNAYGGNARSLLGSLDKNADTKAAGVDRKGSIIKIMEEIDGPRITVSKAVETGPHYEQWPPQSHRIIYGGEGQSRAEVVKNFANRAFRRPVTEDQLAPYLRLAHESPEGIRTAIEAILCSPRFLYLCEEPGKLDNYAIASRLSYFLWNTLPDEELLRQAARGNLENPETLNTQFDRMLRDPRSDEFVQSFVWSWLRLENTSEMAPDPVKYFEYYRNRLDDAMVTETNAFFRHLLDHNLPVSTFIDSDFAILNANLGRHYGIPGQVKTTVQFQKVSLQASQHRGGLLGQASVLTASANGVDTSPVTRGIWVLENLLGKPPSPPPPGIEVPEPDARGAITVRELFAKHRTNESCNTCHSKIDPLGFGLENFDAVGAWRTHYESKQPVDASGKMPSGETFDGIDGLKDILTRDLDLFTRNLTSKLLTHATGRTMDIADRPAVDQIISQAKHNGSGFRDLLKLIVTSDIFLTK